MITALFVRCDSVYKILGIDSYDSDRDACTFVGDNVVICHPPCRAWGRLYKFSKHSPGEKMLAKLAVLFVRSNGGILEHPNGSKLWKEFNLPMPGEIDKYGGYSIIVDQCAFGHKAQKKTILYIVGLPIENLPVIPRRFCPITHVVRPNKNMMGAKIITKKKREATPVQFATWLIELANRIDKNKLNN